MGQSRKCKHGNAICARCVVVSDAAKRMSEAINLHIVAAQPDDLFHNCWLAIRLSDGSTDNIRYPSKAEAIRHQANEFHYCYFSFRQSMGGANPKDCQLFLDFNRHAYDQGFRLADPEAPEMIMPLARGVGRWPL